MKTLFTSLFLFVTGINAFSQEFKVDTLYKTGSFANRVNVVILGDGFTEDELPKFSEEAKKFADFFLRYAPYNHYKNYFNFFAIPTPSKESGVTNPGNAPDAYPEQPVSTKDTYYGASFGSSIHRLVTISNYSAMYNVLAYNLPSWDLVVMLVNTEYYGGSGGSIAVHTLNSAANTIGVHEIGHTFSYLSDEYWAGPQYGRESPNMTLESSPALVKWKNWLNTTNVGVFPHGMSGDAATWFKPTRANCLMEQLDKDLCAVCREATTEKILSLVDPIDSFEPDNVGPVGLAEGDNIFKINLVEPEPNSLKIEWRLDGVLMGGGVDRVNISLEQLPNPTALLTATVFDTTFTSRIDYAPAQRTKTVEWKLDRTNTPVIFKLAAETPVICAGDSTKLIASGCLGTVTWSTGENGNEITVRPERTTEYSATCSANDADRLTVSVTVVPLPVITVTNGGPYFEGATIQLNAAGGENYHWTGPENFDAQIADPTIAAATVQNSGEYEVEVSDTNGCMVSGRTTVRVDPILSAANDPGTFLQIGPNPAKDYIHINTKLPGTSELTLYDSRGRKLISKSFVTTTDIKFNVNSGLYLYRFSNDQKEVTGKLIVQ
jgi:hypothetical protein